MNKQRSFFSFFSLQDIRETLVLALPLMLAFLGLKTMGLVDMAIVGRLSEIDIAGASIGDALFAFLSVVGTGLLLGLDPLLSQSLGAQKEEKARVFLQNSYWVGLGLVPLLLLLAWVLFHILFWMGIHPLVLEKGKLYFLGRVFHLPVLFLFVSFRAFLQVKGTTTPIVIAVVLANIINIPLSLFLVFGYPSWLPSLGLLSSFRGWGVFGAGLATTIVALFQSLFLWAVMRKKYQTRFCVKPQWEICKELVRIGFPIGIQLFAEVGVFVLVTFLMGKFKPAVLAGHHIALQCASLTFMACLGISQSAAIRVGLFVGEQQKEKARLAGMSSIVIGVLFMSCCSFFFLFFGKHLAQFFAKPLAVQKLAIQFLSIAALFQIVDGLQAIAAGALRGAGFTKPSMLSNLVGHWLLGMPLGIFLAFYTNIGPIGLWIGLSTGLAFVGFYLTFLVFKLDRLLS